MEQESSIQPQSLQETKLAQRKKQRQLIQRVFSYVVLSGSGVGIAETIRYLLNSQPIAAGISFLLTTTAILLVIFVMFANNVTDKVFDKIEETLDSLEESLANWIYRKLETFTIKAWWELTSDFKGEYYQQLIYSCRDYLTQGLEKDQVPKLKKVFVPLKISTASTKQVKPEMIQVVNDQDDQFRKKGIWHFLAAIKEQSSFKRMVILGAPGSGKTTLLRYMTLTYANNEQRSEHPKAPKLIPVLIYLREVRQEIIENKPSLAELITNQVKKQRKLKPLEPPPSWFADRLEKNQCLVLFDGLDEVADEAQRQEIRDWVDQQMQCYPEVPFILTSRPYGYNSAPLQEVGIVLEVKPFTPQQMRQFIESWYLQKEIMSRSGEDDLGVQDEAHRQSEDLIYRVLNSRSLAAMAVNPLLLTMIATVHRRGHYLPEKRVELYREICQILLEKRQREKKIHYLLEATQNQAVLQVLALSLMQEKKREFTLPEKRTLLNNQLATVASVELNSDDFVEQIKDVCGLLVEKELGVYEFAHLSFQEYLAAVEIQRTQQENLLEEKIDQSWWHETIRLYAAMGDATTIVRAALKNPTIEAMALAYDCAEEGLKLDQNLRKQLEEKLEADLESQGESFQLAAKVMLKRRLDRLTRIEEGVEIDTTYLTCAEYQLFIDEMQQQDKNRQPDHWRDDRFPVGDAKQPLLGVSARNAKKFCHWLNQQPSKYQYRLPTVQEIEQHPDSEISRGCWCKDKEGFVMMGLDSQQWQKIENRLVQSLIFKHNFNLHRDLTLDVNLIMDRYRDLNYFLQIDRYRKLNRLLSENRKLNHHLSKILTLNQNLNRLFAGKHRNRNLDKIMTLNQDLSRNLHRILLTNHSFNQDLKSVFKFNNDLKRICDCYCRLYEKLNNNLKCDLNRLTNLNHDLNRALRFNDNPNFAFYRHRKLYPDLNRNLEQHRKLNDVFDLNRIFDFQQIFHLNLYQTLESDTDNKFLPLYFQLIFLLFIYQQIPAAYQFITEDKEISKVMRLNQEQCQEISSKCAKAIDKIYPDYVVLMLLYERQKGEIPAWEGIRLVRESINW